MTERILLEIDPRTVCMKGKHGSFSIIARGRDGLNYEPVYRGGELIAEAIDRGEVELSADRRMQIDQLRQNEQRQFLVALGLAPITLLELGSDVDELRIILKQIQDHDPDNVYVLGVSAGRNVLSHELTFNATDLAVWRQIKN
ncbi:MAG: hypothetical protein HYW45_01755 [Candidatus Daviesbacteria bacterium]|nr:MAG: hypothetical protein HYW45_01755 [Candidatus Daviesbacteria bacterium]